MSSIATAFSDFAEIKSLSDFTCPVTTKIFSKVGLLRGSESLRKTSDFIENHCIFIILTGSATPNRQGKLANPCFPGKSYCDEPWILRKSCEIQAISNDYEYIVTTEPWKLLVIS